VTDSQFEPSHLRERDILFQKQKWKKIRTSPRAIDKIIFNYETQSRSEIAGSLKQLKDIKVRKGL
jgi:hypothetical protein